MDNATKQALLAKREEGTQRLKQAEADLYFLQGYLKALDELLEEAISKEAQDESKDA